MPHRVVIAAAIVLALAASTHGGMSISRAQDLAAKNARQPAIYSNRDRLHPQFAAHAMVASQEALATKVGVQILQAGGNAIDAAVAVGFALAVTLPRAGNLGGGGFMLIHHAKNNATHALDYRETAPDAASHDMFVDANGKVDTRAARFSHRSAGVPGTVAGLTQALKTFGTMPLAQVMAPAIRLAREGITVTGDLADSLRARAKRLKEHAPSANIFFKADGSAFKVGERLIQADLARSLQLISEHGAKVFYQGEIAARIVSDMRIHDGLIRAADLAGYRTVMRSPVFGTYRGHAIASMPPPSSGGVHLIQILNVLEGFPIGFLGHNSADTIHLLTESMKLAYADRASHLGDADFIRVPVQGLTSKSYAGVLRERINLQQARPSAQIAAGRPAMYESNETTHFSIMDAFGNVVANTYTINFSYGSGIVVPGTGILLNNEMDDFSAKPGAANAYGLIGSEANAIEPRKRPLSSMTPTIVFRAGKALLATGSPGGSRIISTTAQVIMNVIDHRMNIAEAVAAPRIHHQWFPDELRVESGISPDTLAILRARGHAVVENNAMGSANSVMRTDQGLLGTADSRRRGALAAGY
ncbi:MAG: gamma-glutamyltranspeptidase/glutathione hydrolase [Gammaproteobacteria bacterium]|jgi:gamma-glutamyltranspeptidase/glutathione hydrolase